MRSRWLFLLPLFVDKKEISLCRDHLDCPRYQYCDKLFSVVGYCRDLPFVPLPIPVPAHEIPSFVRTTTRSNRSSMSLS